MVAPTQKRPQTIRVRISKSGQITLPAKIREELGVELGDQVDIVREKDGRVSVKPVRHFTAAELAGSLGPRPDDVDVDELIREGVREGVERRMARWKK